MSYEIKLEGLQFHAYHGVYEYEQKAGNTFVLDLAVCFSLARLPLDDKIEDAPDYLLLHTLAAEEMNTPRQLLETLAASISKKIWQAFPDALKVKVTIKKLNPPISRICEASTVTVETAQPF